LDRFLEYFGQGYAYLLPETAEHQLGAHLPHGMDGYVFHQVRKRPWHTVLLRRGGRLHPVRHHIHGRDGTFEKKNRSFERLLLAPIPFELLMLAKTSGAILFGVANAFVPVIMAAFLTDLSMVAWSVFVSAVFMIAVASTFLGLFIAVAVSEVFGADFSNFFRFPMIFLCGLFFPIEKLPVFLKPLSYALPLTYGADMLQGAVHGGHAMPFSLDLSLLGAFCVGLFAASLWNIKRKWIL
jgi:ABC-2 type transport system permease protein